MTNSSLVNVLIIIVIIGLIVWVVETYIPMDAMFRTIFRIVLGIAVIVWLLRLAGLV